MASIPEYATEIVMVWSPVLQWPSQSADAGRIGATILRAYAGSQFSVVVPFELVSSAQA